MVEQFIEQIINLDHKNILIFIAIIWVVGKRPVEKVFDFIREFKFRDVDSGLLKLFIEKDNFSRDLSDSLIEYFESLAFYRAYGMRVNKEQRTILLEFYSKYKKEITWRDLKLAYKNIEFVDSSIQVNSYWISILYRFLSTLITAVIGLLMLFLFVNFILFDHGDKSLSAFLIITMYYFVLLSLFDFDKTKYKSIIKIHIITSKEQDNNE